MKFSRPPTQSSTSAPTSSIPPLPVLVVSEGICFAPSISKSRISNAGIPIFAEVQSAIAPVTWGAAIEVPLKES